MNIGFRQLVLVIAVAALLAGGGGLARGAVTPLGGSKCRHASTGVGTTGDWEVVFGRRALRAKAVRLLRRVRAGGFRRAVIEREQCLFEVAIIGFPSRPRAMVIASRAQRRRFKVSIMQS
jgi:hypothetical protein